MAWDSDYRYEPNPLFEEVFRCVPFTKYKKPHLETGDKIIMPPSSLHRITNLPIRYPLLFKIEGFQSNKTSHCGVLEFDAEEGSVHMPEWMMKNLNLQEGACVILSSATLSKGVYMELQPQTTSFIELSNPKAVLEKTLRYFSCLSRGDTFMVRHGGTDFYIDVLRVGPGDAVTLIETDCRVDFAPPLDYKEPQSTKQKMVKKVDGKEEEERKMFEPFTGRGRRMDGEAVMVDGGGESSDSVGGRSDVEVEKGKKSEKIGGEGDGKVKFKPFTGKSHVLGGY